MARGFSDQIPVRVLWFYTFDNVYVDHVKGNDNVYVDHVKGNDNKEMLLRKNNRVRTHPIESKPCMDLFKSKDF